MELLGYYSTSMREISHHRRHSQSQLPMRGTRAVKEKNVSALSKDIAVAIILAYTTGTAKLVILWLHCS